MTHQLTESSNGLRCDQGEWEGVEDPAALSDDACPILPELCGERRICDIELCAGWSPDDCGAEVWSVGVSKNWVIVTHLCTIANREPREVALLNAVPYERPAAVTCQAVPRNLGLCQGFGTHGLHRVPPQADYSANCSRTIRAAHLGHRVERRPYSLQPSSSVAEGIRCSASRPWPDPCRCGVSETAEVNQQQARLSREPTIMHQPDTHGAHRATGRAAHRRRCGRRPTGRPRYARRPLSRQEMRVVGLATTVGPRKSYAGLRARPVLAQCDCSPRSRSSSTS